VLFAIPATNFSYPVFAGDFLGMADGPMLRPKSLGMIDTAHTNLESGRIISMEQKSTCFRHLYPQQE